MPYWFASENTIPNISRHFVRYGQRAVDCHWSVIQSVVKIHVNLILLLMRYKYKFPWIYTNTNSVIERCFCAKRAILFSYFSIDFRVQSKKLNFLLVEKIFTPNIQISIWFSLNVIQLQIRAESKLNSRTKLVTMHGFLKSLDGKIFIKSS